METTKAITVPAAGVALGNFLVCRFVADADAGAATVADTDGNTYTMRIEDAGPAVTVWGYVYTCPVTNALESGDTITLTTAKVSGSFIIDECSGVGTYETASFASGSSTTPSHTLDPTATAGLVVGFMGSNAATVTEDADSTGGDTWHTLTTNGASSRRNHGAYKIITAGDSQTYNVTLSTSAAWGCSILVAAEASTGPTGTFAMTTGTIS